MIVNPRRVKRFTHPHLVFYTTKIFYIIDDNGSVVFDVYTYLIPKRISVHHYITKSKEEFIARRSMGRADIDAYRDIGDFYKHDFKDVRDDSMLYYVAKMRDIKTYAGTQINLN